MNIKYECLYCITRQITKLAKKLTDDVDIQHKIISFGLKTVSENWMDSSAPYVTGLIYEYAKEISGIEDPYAEEKSEFNVISQQLIEEFALVDRIKSSDDAIDTAIRLSIAGNIIDFSLGIDIDKDSVRDSVENSLIKNMYGINSIEFMEKVNKAEKILFLADNAGEIVFDKLLLELLPLDKITYVVKGGAIVNDAIMKDVEEIELDKIVRVIDNGTSIQGTELRVCSEEFLKEFEDADLIISKGQANYESLESVGEKDIIFLLRAKCKTIADMIGCQVGEFCALG